MLGVVTVNKLSRPFSDRFQCGPKKRVPVSTYLQNSGYWGRRQVAKNEVFRCLVEICPPLASGRLRVVFGIAHQKVCLQGRPHGRGGSDRYRSSGAVFPLLLRGERSLGRLCKRGDAMGPPLLGAYTLYRGGPSDRDRFLVRMLIGAT